MCRFLFYCINVADSKYRVSEGCPLTLDQQHTKSPLGQALIPVLATAPPHANVLQSDAVTCRYYYIYLQATAPRSPPQEERTTDRPTNHPHPLLLHLLYQKLICCRWDERVGTQRCSSRQVQLLKYRVDMNGEVGTSEREEKGKSKKQKKSGEQTNEWTALAFINHPLSKFPLGIKTRFIWSILTLALIHRRGRCRTHPW